MSSVVEQIKEMLTNFSPETNEAISEYASVLAQEFTKEELARLAAIYHLGIERMGIFDDDVEEAVDVNELWS